MDIKTVGILILLVSFSIANELTGKNCSFPLGMSNGDIEDSDISASSFFTESLAPQHARLNRENAGGAWCPKRPIHQNDTEFLEINLKERFEISGIKTQGRYGNGHGIEYTEFYKIFYRNANENVTSREQEKWIAYKNQDGTSVFRGNVDTSTLVYQQLVPSVVASRVRIVPHSNYSRFVCLRVELYGCKYQEEENERDETGNLSGKWSPRFQLLGILEFVAISVGLVIFVIIVFPIAYLIQRQRNIARFRYSPKENAI